MNNNNINELLDKMENIPESGYLLIYTRLKVWFSTYNNGSQGIKEYLEAKKDTSDILECHLFDENTESRAVYSEMSKGYICTVISDEKYLGQLKIDNNDDIKPEEYKYEEEMYLTNAAAKELADDAMNYKIKIITYIEYDENDMIQVKNYRYGKVVKEGE
ncbi:MAG: hypothetical protein K6G26_04760 [Lachnospiraceae bacterium]|nr:hypothetical protein [Lachnospiraceae bacterium]